MYMKLSDMDADLCLCEYIIFFNSFTWFPDGLPSGIDEKLSGMDLEPIFTATDRNCRQERIPVGQPIGKVYLS